MKKNRITILCVLFLAACGSVTPYSPKETATFVAPTVQLPTPSKPPVTKTPSVPTMLPSIPETQTIRFDLAERENFSNNYSISPDGKMLAVGVSNNARIFLIDGKEAIWNKDFPFEIKSLSWASDNNRLAIGNSEGQILVWDISKNHPIKTYNSSAEGTGVDKWIDHIAWSSDGKLLAATNTYETVDVWNLESNGKVLTMLVPFAMSISISPNNAYMVIGTETFYPDNIRVFELANGNEVKLGGLFTGKLQQNNGVANVSYKNSRFSLAANYSPPLGGCGGFTDVAWSPNGKMMAAVEQCQGLILVWDTTTWNLLYSLDGGFTFIAWSADGKYLATDDMTDNNHQINCTVQIWSVISGATDLILTSQINEYSRDMVWANDGKLLLVNHTGDIVIWNLP